MLTLSYYSFPPAARGRQKAGWLRLWVFRLRPLPVLLSRALAARDQLNPSARVYLDSVAGREESGHCKKDSFLSLKTDL